MKKAVIFIVLAMVVIGFCAAQSATDAQRLVGTWVSESEYQITYVFNANGTGTVSSGDDLNVNIFWGVSASGELLVINTKRSNSSWKDTFYLSPDSRRMIIRSTIYQKK